MSTLKIVYRSLPLFITFALYGYSLRLPFFLDDSAHFQILAQSAGFEFWGDFPTFPFYRPVAFTLWKSYELLTGTFDPVAFHALNLFCFGIAGVLTGQIVYRVLPERIRLVAAGVAGMGFVLFPLSYQAVAMVAALFHLTLAVGVTASLWLALLWLDGRIGFMGVLLCWFFALIAVFSHESGVLLLPLLVGLIGVTYYNNLPPRRKLVLLLLPITLIVLIYLSLWLSSRPQGGTALTGGMDVALAALLQGLIYPAIIILRPFVEGDINSTVLLLFTLAVIVLGKGFILRLTPDRHVWRFAGYALGWYLLAILPAALFLSPGYVLGQLRLALFASIGAGMLWGVLLGVLWLRSRLLVIVIVVGCVFMSVEFLTMRRDSFLNLREYNLETLYLFEQYDVATYGAVLVNAPGFITPTDADRRFLLGSEGVLFVDPTMDYGLHLTTNAGITYDDIQTIAYRRVQRNVGFGYNAHPLEVETLAVVDIVRSASYVFVTRFDGERFYPELVGGARLTLPSDNVDDTGEVIYADGDYTLLDSMIEIVDGQMIVETQWQVQAPAPVKLFVHIYCDDTFIAQSDGYPWGDTYPFQYWTTGEIQTDRRVIPVDAPEACLRAYVGLYYEADVTRLNAIEVSTSSRLVNDQYLIE